MKSIFESLAPVNVLEIDGRYAPIDLSVQNNELSGDESAAEMEAYVKFHLLKHQAAVAWGGYGEKRNLYKRSDLFEDEAQSRDTHLGIDLWAPAGTPVLAALDGTVHSFDYNAGLGNYGPTIILEHQLKGETFYTLYGHLSVESIADLEIGDEFRAGDCLGELGGASVNGNYAPHLHFQIIRDLEDHFGDYPGVCASAVWPHYQENCPNPNLLLKIQTS